MLKGVKIVEVENPCKVTLHSTAATAIRTAQSKAKLTKENLKRFEVEDDLDAVPKPRLTAEEKKDFVAWSDASNVLTRKIRAKELTRRLADSLSDSNASFEKGKSIF